MKSKEKTNQKVLDLTWSALPFFERWMNSKQGWMASDRYIDEQIKSQKWQIKHTESLLIILPILAVLIMLVPGIDWKLPTLFVISFIGLNVLDVRLKERLDLLLNARNLSNKLKKDA